MLQGSPARVLVVRKKCPSPSYWACDLALPGGRIVGEETPVETALREAWEEAWVPPGLVYPITYYCCELTRAGKLRVSMVVARPVSYIEAVPRDEEVDAVLWLPLDIADQLEGPVEHPVRGSVWGVPVPGGLALWGVTLRLLKALRRIYKLLGLSNRIEARIYHRSEELRRG
ncbi:MAG: NUDIX domain-containing protein [Desulfurococcales archaeon]|nr:NUDIX domain-containing protein [Desulfurococcales archaeon]